jgi:ubiquinone/menaquinone biosynthesis C-methylase UbiE
MARNANEPAVSPTCRSKHQGPSLAEDVRRLNGVLRDNYSRTATQYDAERSINAKSRRFFDRAYDTVDRLLGPLRDEAIHVDMPVGTGRLLLHLRGRGRRHCMIGIDIAPGMLAVCRANAAARGAPIALSFGDAFRLPLADDSVDALTSLRFFHLFPPRLWPALLAEMHRVLRPGGILIAEFRNQFRALAGGLLKEYRDRWLRHDQPHAFIRPGGIRPLFADWGGFELCGIGLDGATTLARLSLGWASRLECRAMRKPLCFFTKELLVKAWKGTGSA